MNDPCIDCGERPATREGGWMLCEPCWQAQCDEVEKARTELAKVKALRRVLPLLRFQMQATAERPQ